MLTRRTLLFCAAATAVLASSAMDAFTPARGQTPDAASTFIAQTGRDLVAVVNGQTSDAVKQQQLGAVIDRVVDVPAVAQFVLGRFWRTATPQQRDEFTSLFRKVIVTSIGGHLGEYKGVSFTIDRAVPTDAGMSVRTTLNRPGAPPARVDWIVSSASGSPKIIDLLAEGTSLRLTQRSDYSSFLVNHGNSVQELIAALRRQVEAAQ
jgi:phospholipid transport system substrate-binding protein